MLLGLLQVSATCQELKVHCKRSRSLVPKEVSSPGFPSSNALQQQSIVFKLLRGTVDALGIYKNPQFMYF